jgi:segregation and condensation protein A
LELLLNLIEERKLHPSRVSLAAVTDDFIGHLKTLEASPREHKNRLANFLVVAATLMLVKSIALLPNLEVSREEEGDIDDLEERLRLYQKVREAARVLATLFGAQPIFAPSDRATPEGAVFAPSAELTPANLEAACRSVLANLPRLERLPQVVVEKAVSLEETIADLAARVQSALKMSFKDYLTGRHGQANPVDRVAVIISFLGLLELVKQGAVSVSQTSHYQDISLEATGPASLPRYD